MEVALSHVSIVGDALRRIPTKVFSVISAKDGSKLYRRTFSVQEAV